ncbi:pre-rRNA processing protein [Exophiala xenobiotica]|nr:pre-rRNA processing protein [Exophiala xenobiotica]KAK5207907.1 pre-rRNA processing protein [Exophiala xenobiotica]KAK5219985.1 pre-rRNA processing protein [Exophiala xenobiotica]KAK5292802.1 pre-rRNA processing protein [Exophiala xenobiotica]KAK5322434.1 pre-rRNA processing protein [Exophiala xenobiotica]
MSLEEKLAKIKSPNLQSQQHTTVVLSSIEETLSEQKTKFTPTAYFAALLALLKQSSSAAEQSSENEILTSTVYLLDLVTSYVSASLLRTQFSTILSLLAPLLSATTSNAPLLRSAIGCLESLLVAQDSAAWKLPQNQTSPRQAIVVLLTLAIDSRPKIRKRAQEALTKVLKTPPPGPAIDHPAAELCAVAAQNNLKNAVDTAHQAKRQRSKADDGHEPAVIHALQLTKTIAVASGGWPSKKIESLCELLLAISRSRNDFLVMSAFEVFEVIFEGMQDEVSSSKLPRLLEAIVELKPGQNDSQLIPPWIAILSRGYGTAGEVEPEDTFAKLPELFDLVAGFLTSPSHNIRVSASECLISFFANCVPDSAISDPSVYDEKLLEQISQKALGLLAVKYQSAWMEVFSALAALFDALRWRGDPYLLPIVKAIGGLRSNEGFQGKKEADEVLGHAIRNLGPGAVLSILPHNLIKPQPGQPGRAWLLPVLRDHVSNTYLAHFKADLVPLSEAMYQRVLDHGKGEKTMDIKIFETVIQQVWATLPGYCDLPLDLQVAMDQPFAEMISNLLYQQTELRVDLCRGLQNLVESYQALLASDLPDEILLLERRMSRSDAEKNIQHLSTFAGNLLAVLFNVYSQTLPQSRAYILQCINAYLSITPEKDLVDTFERVSKMLEEALPKPKQQPPKKEQSQAAGNKLPPTSHTLLDLVIALSVHLPRSTFSSLFSISSNILTNSVVLKSDPQLIKKSYKLIPRLATSKTGSEALTARNTELQQLILQTSETTPVPARRDRILAIQTLISFLPLSDLHFIPSILSEVVLACKDSNEKARTAGFDLLIAVTNKISDPTNPPDTVIRNRFVSHMPDDSPDAPASLEEVFTMVSAGLAGVAPHMVAASVIALSRLLWEYHNQLSDKTKVELVDTVTMFLQSNNREIVRAVLGFVKVMVVVLPVAMLEPRMPAIVPGLMVWSKENKGRLRAKIKGILDRCLRRFDAAKVESWAGGDDRKMIVNIRKRRDRAKKKNKGIDEDGAEEEEEEVRGRERYDNEFDEAVYGSEDDDSEIDGGGDSDEDGDDTMSGVAFKKSSAGTRRGEQYIRQEDEDDEPLDLLDPKSMGNISSRKLGRLRDAQASSRKTKAKVNEDGKLVFGGNDNDNEADEDVDVAMSGGAGQDNSINAYLDAVSGADAVRRGQKGKLKVKSGMQKKTKQETRQRDGEMDLDVEEAREVARQIMQGSGSPRSPGARGRGGGRGGKQDARQQRRGLGVEKSRGPTQRQNFRGGGGVGKRGRGNARFAGRPARGRR